jgi:hypothetical protein
MAWANKGTGPVIDARKETSRPRGFEDVVVGADIHTFTNIIECASVRVKDDRHMIKRPLGSNSFARLEAAQFGQINFEDDEARPDATQKG